MTQIRYIDITFISANIFKTRCSRDVLRGSRFQDSETHAVGYEMTSVNS
jgi:hypothetical protein